jgi:hypothetical protein
MAKSAWVIVVLSAWHMAAISIASIPLASDMEPPASESVPTQWISRQVGPVLDDVQGAWLGVLQASEPVLGRLRRVARAYSRAIRLEQRWNMFSEPPAMDQYAHMRYYVTSGARDVMRVDRELIFPAARRDDRFRFFNVSYYEEKALRNARQGYLRRLRNREDVTRIAQLPRDLVPVVRYYANRYRTRNLTGNETIARAEIWLGNAPVPPPGTPESEEVLARASALAQYYDDARPTWAAMRSRHPVGYAEREGDITWTLMFVEEPPQ